MYGGKMRKYMAGGLASYAPGGYLNAPSTKSIPALLHGGEFILNHKAVQRIGTDTLSALNNYRLSTPRASSFRVPGRNIQNGIGTTSSTQNVNIYVDNFIGEPQWFESMMKQYNVSVAPLNRKKAGMESRVISSYTGLGGR
jgi:hypothetical protein